MAWTNFYVFYVIVILFSKFKSLMLLITTYNYRVANESTLRSREPTLCNTHAHVSTARGVWSAIVKKIVHTHYFCIFWVLSIQIGYSMYVVNGECINQFYSFWKSPIPMDGWILWGTGLYAQELKYHV